MKLAAEASMKSILALAVGLLMASGIATAFSASASQASPPPLQLESKIPLGAVRGRIDHFAIDLPGSVSVADT